MSSRNGLLDEILVCTTPLWRHPCGPNPIGSSSQSRLSSQVFSFQREEEKCGTWDDILRAASSSGGCTQLGLAHSSEMCKGLVAWQRKPRPRMAKTILLPSGHCCRRCTGKREGGVYHVRGPPARCCFHGDPRRIGSEKAADCRGCGEVPQRLVPPKGFVLLQQPHAEESKPFTNADGGSPSRQLWSFKKSLKKKKR